MAASRDHRGPSSLAGGAENGGIRSRSASSTAKVAKYNHSRVKIFSLSALRDFAVFQLYCPHGQNVTKSTVLPRNVIIKCIRLHEILTFTSQDISHRGHVLKFHRLLALKKGLTDLNYLYVF